jgi:hypothetical protein
MPFLSTLGSPAARRRVLYSYNVTARTSSPSLVESIEDRAPATRCATEDRWTLCIESTTLADPFGVHGRLHLDAFVVHRS